MYARGALPATDPTLDGERTVGADDAPNHAYGYEELDRGDSVGRYLVLRPLGRGGMGAVYAAHDPELDRTVALKIVRRSGSRGVSLKEEAQTLARLSHPNVVSVHDVGEITDGVFIAMEYVEGRTLRKWAKAHRDDLGAVSSVMRDAGRGLAAAHEAGLVHLDFKPDNVMIADDGRVLVLDFGLAQPKERTGTGTALAPAGTPAYMAPEMFRQEPLDDRADQFSFCVTWLESALGQRPFRGDTPSMITRAILDGDAELPPRPAGIGRNAWQALLRGISADASERWPSMAALLEATQPPRKVGRQTVVAAVVAGSLGAGAMWAFAGTDARCGDAGARVGEVWSEADAEAMRARAAGEAPALPAERAQQIIDRLDEYAAQLGEGYIEACKVAPDDLPRRVCLDGRTEALRASRDVALEGDVEATSTLFDLLQDVRACRRADEDALYREVSDPARANAVLAGLARGNAALEAGRFEEADEALEGVVEEADALGWRGIESLARLSLAAAADYRGQPDVELAQIDRALTLASEAGSDEATFQALSKILGRHALHGDVAAVEALLPAVSAAAVRAGKNVSDVEIARGNALQLTGDYAGADAAYARVVEQTDDEGVRLRALSNVGGIALYRGEYGRAKEVLETALPGFRKRYGKTAVATLKAEANLADADQQLGNPDAAIERYLSILERYAQHSGDALQPAEHVKLNLATALLGERGDVEQAREVGAPAAERMLELHGREHVFSIAARDFLNALAWREGKRVEAHTGTLTLIEDLTRLLGPDTPLLAILKLSLARQALALEDAREGLDAVAAAEPLLIGLNPEHPYLIEVYALRSELSLLAGDTEAAVVAGTEAVRRADASPETTHPVRSGSAHFALARAKHARADPSAEVLEELDLARARFGELPTHPDARLDALDELEAQLEGM
ncbi:MAG: protein kinase domain-containing protein [Nannocystaceae bacterium]|nr:serine/threonine-protein kinase [bacterium]